MSRFYCPYCSSRYQFHDRTKDGVLICGQCGDPLIKKTFINSRQIVGIIAASAFITPLLIMIIFLINDFIKEEKFMNKSDSLVLYVFQKVK